MNEETKRLFMETTDYTRKKKYSVLLSKKPSAIELRSDATLDIWTAKMLAYYKGISKRDMKKLELSGNLIRCVFYEDNAG